MGSERQVAGRVPAGPHDDEREARLDAEARRRVPRAAEGRDGDRADAAQQGGRRRARSRTPRSRRSSPSRRTTTTVIKIEPAKPEVVYVPTYNPTVVYGAWPYPSYPPYYYYPPGYVGGRRAAGVHRRRDRGRRAVGRLQLGRQRRQHQRQPLQQLQPARTSEQQLEAQRRASRRGAYRDKAVAQQNGRGRPPMRASRDAFRGRADAGPAVDPARRSAPPRNTQMDRGSAGMARATAGPVARGRGAGGAGNWPTGGAGGNYAAGVETTVVGGGYSGASAGQRDMSGRGSPHSIRAAPRRHAAPAAAAHRA